MKKFLPLLMLLFISIQSFSQDTIAPIKKAAYCYHQNEYNHLITNKLFKKGMTDDEMAGILLYKGGRELTGSFVCELFGVIAGSLGVVFYQKNTAVGTACAVGSGIFFIVGIVNLMTGYSKISKAGIILQHKGIGVKVSGNGISLNF